VIDAEAGKIHSRRLRKVAVLGSDGHLTNHRHLDAVAVQSASLDQHHSYIPPFKVSRYQDHWSMIHWEISRQFQVPFVTVARGQPRTMAVKQFLDNQFLTNAWSGPSSLRAAAQTEGSSMMGTLTLN
jgi:hypothetical protein